MGFFDRFSNKASRFSAQNNNNPLQAFTQSLQRMWSKPPKRDNAELPDLAHKSPRLDPIFIIGRSIASTPWNIYNKLEYRQNGKTAKPILNSPLYDLLDMPIGRYPEIDWYSLCYSTIAVIKAVGGYYWLKVRDDKGQVVELDPIPPAWVPMQPTINNPYYTIYPIGVTAAKALIVSPDDIVRFKRPDLSDPYGNGRGDSEQLEDEFQIDEFSAKAEMNLLYNDATPPYIITAPGMPQDQAEAFKKSWMQKLGGYLHRREPGVLGFDAKIQTLAMSPVEMDLMESRKFIREEVYQHYQIPPEIYGNIENSNRATIQSAEYLFHKNVLNTEYRFMERVIDRQLVQVDFDRNLCFRFDDCVPEDEDFKLATLNAGLTGGVVQVDEWRKAFDLPELPNNKGKVFLRTFAQYEVPADGREEPTEPTPSEPTSPEGSQTTGQTEDKPTEDPNMAKPDDDTSKAIIRIVSKSVTDSFNCDDKTTIRIVSKYNDNHDESGRFAPSDGGGSSSEGSYPGDSSVTVNGKLPESFSQRGPDIYFHAGGTLEGKIKEYGQVYLDDGSLGYAPEIGDDSGDSGEVWRMHVSSDAGRLEVNESTMRDIADRAFDDYKNEKLSGEHTETVEQYLDAHDGDYEEAKADFVNYMAVTEIGNENAWDQPGNVGLVVEYAGYPDIAVFPRGAIALSMNAFDATQNQKEYQEAKKNASKQISSSTIHHKAKSEARRTAIWKAFDARATSKEGEFIQAVKKYSATQKKRVIDALDSSKLDSAIENKSDYGKEIEVALGEVFNDKANKALKSALAPAWLDSMDAGRQQTYDMIGKKPEKAIDKAIPKITPSLTVTNTLFNGWIEENGLLKAEGINETTNEALRKKLAQAISDGISNGDTLNTIKNSILDICDGVYDEMSSSRAENIAKTESTTTINFAVKETGKAEGMTQKEFLATMDDRVRDAHAEADGQIVDIDSPFIVDGEELQYPGDPNGSASNICRCRCSMIMGNADIPLGEE